MASSDDGRDVDWRLDDISWDADTMEASAKDLSSGGRGSASPRSGRGPNTSCQAEGCTAVLPVKSYYQRQHICEEHFRAMVVTEPSGRTMRFCQQCTRLEPLDNFDGTRRSCRESLLRRNMRRQGRRTGTGAQRARQAKRTAKPAATAGASGSGDSTTRGPRNSSPSGTTTAPPSEPPSSTQPTKRARTQSSASLPPVSTGYWLQLASGPDSGGGSAANSGHLQVSLPPLGATQQREAPQPAPASQALPAGLQATHAVHALPSTGPAVAPMQLAVSGMGPPELGSLSCSDLDQLLDLDSDHLADLLLASSKTYPAAPAVPAVPAVPPPSEASAAAAHSGWALPMLAPQQQVFYQLPASAAMQLHAPQQLAAGLGPAPLAAVYHLPPQAAMHTAPPQLQAALQWQPAMSKAAAAAGPDVATYAAPVFGEWPASTPQDAELDVLLDCFELRYEEVRLSLKLYGVHPDQLPVTLRAELMSALAVLPTPAQAAIRSGCVQLTLSALIDAEERQRLLAPGAAATVLARLLPLVQHLPAQRAALQLGQGSSGSAALLAAPRSSSNSPFALLALQLGGGGSASRVPPALLVQAPLTTTVSACRGFFRLRCPRGLLWGTGGLTALCRRAGTGHVALSMALAGTSADVLQKREASAGKEGGEEEEGGEEAAWPGSEGEASEDDEEEEAESDPDELVDVEAWVPFQPPAVEHGAAAGSDLPVWQAGWGLYEFELARGALVGPAMPVLVLPDAHAAAAAELASLPPGPKAATVLRLVALALRYLEQREGATGPQAAAAFQARYPPVAVARLAAAARQLLSLARRAGWREVAALVQPAAIADGWHPARAALMTAPQAAAAAPAPTAAERPAAAELGTTAQPQPAGAQPAAAEPPAAQPVAPAGQEAVHVVGTLLPAPAPAASPPAQADASGSGGSPRKPSSSSGGPWAGKAAAGDGKELEAQLAELSDGDSLRRVMHPAVLCAASLAVAGCVLGLGWALGAGHL